jgi:antitoxin (DNA-binding transcriptional repressor) of toxin-antitoxin stability system
MVERGEEVIIARHGKPIAQVVPVKRPGLVLGAAVHDSNINREALQRDDWWRAMTEVEVEAWLQGRR